MAKASASIDLPVSPGEVWQLIGGFGSLPDWQPAIPKSELHDGGRTRHLNSGVIVERLMAFDEPGRSYTYHILQSPFPQKDYLSTLRVRELNGGKGSRVEWSGELLPTA
jgi:hypothetical protein